MIWSKAAAFSADENRFQPIQLEICREGRCPVVGTAGMMMIVMSSNDAMWWQGDSFCTMIKFETCGMTVIHKNNTYLPMSQTDSSITGNG